jgi:hypothetical protein
MALHKKLKVTRVRPSENFNTISSTIPLKSLPSKTKTAVVNNVIYKSSLFSSSIPSDNGNNALRSVNNDGSQKNLSEENHSSL